MKKLFAIVILALLATALIARDHSVSNADKPNVVFIFADDLGWGDLKCYGHPYAKTPSLDQLASEGTRFEKFYVTGVTCCPSRTGIMTSRHPASYPKYMARYGFAGRTTVTEIFRQNGYVTGHFGKWHMGREEQDGIYGIDEVEVIGGNKTSDGGRDVTLFEEAMKFIEKHREEPFYVNIWGHITHYPVDPVESLVEQFKDLKVDRSDFGKHMQKKFDDCERLGGDIQVSMRNYLADVYSLDMQVGRVMRLLDNLGIADNTIVIFSSDQGPAPVILGNEDITDPRYTETAENTGLVPSMNMLGYAGGFRGGKHTQFEGGVRSPLIVRWPGKVPASKVNKTSIVSGLDYLPTLCNLVGIKYKDEGFEGENMADVIKGSDRQRVNTELFWRTSSANANPSMLDGNWKMHQTGRGYELYDLSVDEKEMVDVSAKYPEVVKEMRAKMDKWVAGLPKSYEK